MRLEEEFSHLEIPRQGLRLRQLAIKDPVELDIKDLGLQVDPSLTKDQELHQLEDLRRIEDPVIAVEDLQVLKSMDHLLEEVIEEVPALDDKDRQLSLKVTELMVDGQLMTTTLKLTTVIKDLMVAANKAALVINIL